MMTPSATTLPTVPAGGDRRSRSKGRGYEQGRRDRRMTGTMTMLAHCSFVLVPRGLLITGEGEGRGTTTGVSLSSVMFDDSNGGRGGGWCTCMPPRSYPSCFHSISDGGGMYNPHTTPFPLIHPPIDGGDPFKMIGWRITHTLPPHLTSFTPPLWGVFFVVSLTTTGMVCIPHAIPFFYPPYWRECT
jgi:hypothetical protein